MIPENELVPILLLGLARRFRGHVIPGFCRRMGGTREVSDPITARGMFCRQILLKYLATGSPVIELIAETKYICFTRELLAIKIIANFKKPGQPLVYIGLKQNEVYEMTVRNFTRRWKEQTSEYTNAPCADRLH